MSSLIINFGFLQAKSNYRNLQSGIGAFTNRINIGTTSTNELERNRVLL